MRLFEGGKRVFTMHNNLGFDHVTVHKYEDNTLNLISWSSRTLSTDIKDNLKHSLTYFLTTFVPLVVSMVLTHPYLWSSVLYQYALRLLPFLAHQWLIPLQVHFSL